MAFPFTLFDRLRRPARTRSGIEAGGGGRRWEGAAVLPAPAASTLAARGQARMRAAAAYMNTPAGRRAVEVWTSNLVGRGYQVRSRHSDRATARRLNDDFEALTNPLLPGLVRAVVRDGEALVRLTPGPHGLRLQQLPGEQLDPSHARDLGGGARIVAGVEFDADEAIVAYHLLRDAPDNPLASWAEPVRVPAAEVLHVFDPLFPGQVRGLSWLAPVALKLRDRDEASDAMLMALKVQSLLTGFVRDPEGGAAGFEDGAGGTALNVSLEPGAMRILPPGAEVTFSSPGSGLAQAVDFLRAQDREIAAGLGLTFEQLTGDLGEANYSSARTGLLEFRRRCEMLQDSLIVGQFLRPLWARWVAVRQLAGELAGDPDELRAVRFIGPGWQWVDPRNDIEAEVAAINAGLKSREEVVAGRGRDIDDLDEERARDRAPAVETAE